MKRILVLCGLLALLLSAHAGACELSASVGKQLVPYAAANKEILGPGMVTVGCRYEHKVDFEAYWFGEQTTKYPGFVLKSYGGIGISRIWESDHHWFGVAEFKAGLFFKNSDRCKFNGDVDCNRRVPLPVSFLFGAGLTYHDWRIQIGHISNDALDHGPEAKNLGQNFARLTYRFR